MAIVDMAKIRLVGLSYQKEEILNALSRTCAVELSNPAELENTFVKIDVKSKELATEKYERAKNGVEFITEQLEKAKGTAYYPKEVANVLTNFSVSYAEFLSAPKREKELLFVIDKLETYQKDIFSKQSEKVKLGNLKLQLLPYADLTDKFSSFKDTKTTKVYLGLIKQENLPALKEFIKDIPLAELTEYNAKQNALISIIAFNEVSEDVFNKATELGFTKCNYDFDKTPIERISENDYEISQAEEYIEDICKKTCKESVYLKKLKILTDYYKFALEKLSHEDTFRQTQATFTLEGFVPKEQVESVKKSVLEVTESVFIEVLEIDENDKPPTLTKNNRVVRQAEFITDMYSTPAYNEVDPSKIVFVFFMLFMGLIMADIGYGILMIALGAVLSSRIKVDNGAKRLWNIIAIGGIFAIIFGVLFNSFFGFEILPFRLLPNPVPSPETGTDGLMTILLSCLGLGVLQLAVGYLYKAINCFKHGEIVDGLLDGMLWVLFFIGFVFATFNFLIGYLMPDALGYMDQGVKAFFDTMQLPGIIMLVSAVVIAALTAGRKEKGFGKFSKGFGAVYGLINIMSDILSYARLFGLMLSGMIIASTFNDMGMGMILGGGIGYVFGALIMVVGHTFNIAMGVLGAYIHDSRLQYIEFFSKFYTGEGNKFSPLGSKTDYIYLTK
ncbi:MAG: V-type ATP synthase subunit I [Clostridia bacterium]|nr:V-type ATP synthase subunit I [Clostridia bacterium]